MSFAIADEALSALGERLVANGKGAITGFDVAFGELNLTAGTTQIVQALSALRDDATAPFQQLIDVTAVDRPERAKRFEVVYHLLSMTANRRVRLKVEAGEGEAVPTATGVYPCADWYERETFDMFGIPFDGHPDLRRLLTDYGFQGHPLRKDFPMTGYVELRYDDEQKRVVYEPVKITQFRAFDFLSPWEGAEYALPGDEKAEAK
jgi:NADH-quinone oxidoreductase subunit C